VNQTPAATEANRVSLNTWLRTVPSPLTGVVEIADVFETARNSGLWKVNGTANYYTTDGIHPSALGHTDAAAVIPATPAV
jgi:hypothetical protein